MAGDRAQAPETDRRLAIRCTGRFERWLIQYAEYCQVTVADIVAQALLRHAEGTGYALHTPPPQRVTRRRRAEYRQPGPWPEKADE